MFPTPWFAPQLTPPLIRLMSQLGHRTFVPKGKVIFAKCSFFSQSRIHYVKSGFVAQALIHTGSNFPMLVTLSSNGSFCGGEQEIYAKDPMPRKHWAVTDCEILSVPTELLRQLADRNISIHRELAAYAAQSANNDRIGMLISHMADDEQRLGVFAASMFLARGENLSAKCHPGEWLELPKMPHRDLISSITMVNQRSMNEIIKSWVAAGDLAHRNGRIWLSAGRLEPSYKWLRQLMDETGMP